MGEHTEEGPQASYDVSIMRPELRVEDIQLRGQGMSPERLKGIKTGLLTLHTAETMAVNIYKYQITSEVNELNRLLIAAMGNEMTHLQDFQIKLFEYGWRPSKLRWINWIVSAVFGYISRLRGRKAILETGIWVETKAIHHYEEFLKTIEWDEDTRKIIEKNQADEHEHISRWKKLLQTSEA
jgi:demethoxyubiquinone hydroxylase (CLK1/Coq7/Cat5 family)